MSNIDWKAKLTSRKFWLSIANFVTMLIIALKGSEETATEVSALILAGASVIAYVIGEGLCDAAGAKANGVIEHIFPDVEEEEPEEVDTDA